MGIAMADIINLRLVRKRKAREAAELEAAANRLKFGRTKSQKARDAAEVEDARRKLEQKKLEEPPEK
jgi:hypothetical protein